jgi:lysophospholipase L1-like esterase
MKASTIHEIRQELVARKCFALSNMIPMKKILLLTFLFYPAFIFSQSNYSWYEPTWVNGICVLDSSNIYNRLPVHMQSQVRKPVWDLSQNAAGEFICFKTTARNITVQVLLGAKQFAFPHMPQLGVSGVDLYAVDKNGAWNWAPANFSFGDTATFQYKDIQLAGNAVTEFYLYLPLYNTVKWLSIGVPANEKLQFVKESRDKPIVAYGTSILQGACASRAGLAWSNILGRRLDRTIINLGFSGNGRLEQPIFDLMATVDASLFIIDCMPNVTHGTIADDEIKDRVYYGIKKLRSTHPEVPVLLVEHAAGYGPYVMDTAKLNAFHKTSVLIAKIFDGLKAGGYKNIYLLSEKAIGFDVNSTPDGLHPNDIGMMQYAEAYEKIIRDILREPAGTASTKIPVEQYRDGYDWLKRHEEVKANTRKTNPKSIILANSIINYWGGVPAAESGIARGVDSWEKYMTPLQIQNAGFGWDRIENTLWHVYHGILDDFNGKKILVMIGTNNVGINTEKEIIDGLQFLLTQIRLRKPDAEIIMAAILPRKNLEKKVDSLNSRIKEMALKNRFKYVDFSRAFLKDGKINAALFLADGLHPGAAGYEVMGREISKVLQ